jgi:hypothetical protein
VSATACSLVAAAVDDDYSSSMLLATSLLLLCSPSLTAKSAQDLRPTVGSLFFVVSEHSIKQATASTLPREAV